MWARQVGDSARVNVPVAPVRHQLYITQPLVGVDPNYPILRFADAAVYVRAARGGLMLGGFESDPLAVDPRREREDFSVDDLPLDIKVLERQTESVLSQVPALQDIEVAEHRGGCFTMTTDGRFLAGPAPELRGFWLATGCNGTGFSLSPAIGQVLAEWIVGGAPSIDVTSLAPARFASTFFTDEELRDAGVWQYAHYYDPGP
jgi:4-methylaminobutanoate oxidase (formaldehyde-forming)